jgi:hypothetical protein
VSAVIAFVGCSSDGKKTSDGTSAPTSPAGTDAPGTTATPGTDGGTGDTLGCGLATVLGPQAVRPRTRASVREALRPVSMDFL